MEEINHLKLETEIKEIISTMTELKFDEIKLDEHLYKDLGIDSIKGIELAVALQERYKVQIDDDRIKDLISVRAISKEIVRLLERKLKG